MRNLAPLWRTLGRLLIFWQIISASHCTHIRKFEYRYTTWNRPVTFKQRVLLAARQVASGILRKNLACKLGVLLLNRLRSRGRGPFHDSKGGTLLFAVSTPTASWYETVQDMGSKPLHRKRNF